MVTCSGELSCQPCMNRVNDITDSDYSKSAPIDATGRLTYSMRKDMKKLIKEQKSTAWQVGPASNQSIDFDCKAQVVIVKIQALVRGFLTRRNLRKRLELDYQHSKVLATRERLPTFRYDFNDAETNVSENGSF